MKKTIDLEPGKPPQFHGNWTMGDFYGLLKFILEMPLIQEQPEKQVNDDK